MKSDTEILDFLQKYTMEKGVFMDKLVEIYENEFSIRVSIDIKSAFPDSNEKNKITGFLRRNGFSYISDDYYRNKSYRNKS
jgi:hypothetical protein